MLQTAIRWVYRFGGVVSDGGAGDKNPLGGKGANLDATASIGLPVPPGFTISTEMCARYYEDGETFPESPTAEVANGIAHIEGLIGKHFGDAADPPLVSVRSGARVSMPVMMDTVLNLGLNDATVEGRATSPQPAFQLSQTEEAHGKDELILQLLARGFDREQVIFELVCEQELLVDLDE